MSFITIHEEKLNQKSLTSLGNKLVIAGARNIWHVALVMGIIHIQYNRLHLHTVQIDIALHYMVAMVVMQHAIYGALDCFDLPTHWATRYHCSVLWLTKCTY